MEIDSMLPCWRGKDVRTHSARTISLEHVPVAKELGEGAVRHAELVEEAHRVDGVTSAAGALRPLPLLPRPGWAVARRRGGGTRVATEQVTMLPSRTKAEATAGCDNGAAR